MRYAIYQTAWGWFGCVVRKDRLVASHLPADESMVYENIRRDWPEARRQQNLLPDLKRSVLAYFNGRAEPFDVRVDLSERTPFQRAVLQACRRIPHGQTATYADLARKVGNPKAARAVGRVMATNPMPLVIPCHRVLCGDGSLGGFSSPGGVELKKRLLRFEDDSLVTD